MTGMTIYFAGAIRGGRADQALYLEIIDLLRHHGTVLTEHIGEAGLQAAGEDQSDTFIHDRDLDWLRSADVLVAEVTTPSLGVGYEIGRCIEWGTPVLCLYRPAEGRRLSGMIAGCRGAIVREYQAVADVPVILREVFQPLAAFSEMIVPSPAGMKPLEPCYTADLFRPLSKQLVALLRDLAPSDWDRPTLARQWRVRDVATHLLDGQIRNVATLRDGHAVPPDAPIHTGRELATFINRLNAHGVAYGARLSPRVITDLLEVAGTWMAAAVSMLDPHAPAVYPVSWAGETASENWMNTGREYAEQWHHQMQIRDAVSKPRLLEPQWMLPLLEMSVRALPHAYAAVDAPAGAVVTLQVNGETTGAWSITRDLSRWQLTRGRPAQPDAILTVSADDVWRMFYNALAPDALAERVRVEGNTDLTAPMLRARSVIV